MSSKRGRKRNDNLPPNRARDVQRAFRARRAAHLLALEQRVSELEAENARLRKMVGWPPDDRPPLGKGPTGKDKPRPFDPDALQPVDFFTPRESVSPAAESSAASARTGSLSPSTLTTGMHVIDSDVWENALTMTDHTDHPPDSPEQYTMPTMSTHKSMYSYPHSYPSSASTSVPSPRHSLPTTSLYVPSPPASAFPHSHSQSQSNERHLGSSYGSPSFVIRGADMREEPPRTHYNYTPSYSDPQQHPISPGGPSSPSSAPPRAHNPYPPHRDTPTVSVPHRRSFHDQYSVAQGMAPISPTAPIHPHHNQQPHQGQSVIRHPEPHRIQDTTPPVPPQYRMAYAPDGRLNSLP